MADVHNKKTTCLHAMHRQRSYDMSMIGSKGHKTGNHGQRNLFIDIDK